MAHGPTTYMPQPRFSISTASNKYSAARPPKCCALHTRTAPRLPPPLTQRTSSRRPSRCLSSLPQQQAIAQASPSLPASVIIVTSSRRPSRCPSSLPKQQAILQAPSSPRTASSSSPAMSSSSGTNEEWVLASYPDGAPQPANFRKQVCPMPSPGPSQVLIKTLCLSVDPYLRIKLYPPPPSSSKSNDNDEGEDDATDEFAPFQLNKALSSSFVGEVVSVGSDVQGFSPGDRVSGVGPWATFAALPANAIQKTPSELPPSADLNVLGLIGLSTYFPLVEIGQPKAGETVFVSGAGAVGSLVGQLCKAFGCKVIGSTGSDNKVGALKSLGFDNAFNYKTKTVEEALEEWAPEGVDVYWDNVGGETLDAVLEKMKRYGRIVACGSISQYHVLGSE